MNKKTICGCFIAIVLFVLNSLIFSGTNIVGGNLSLSYKLISNIKDSYQVFYANDEVWTEENSKTYQNDEVNKMITINYDLPHEVTKLRFDLGNMESVINLADVKLVKAGHSISLDLSKLRDSAEKNNIKTMNIEDNQLHIVTDGNDPYITYQLGNELLDLNKSISIMEVMIKGIICLVIDFIGILLFFKINVIKGILKDIRNNKTLIWNLSKNDFKTKYAGSYLGITWAFVQPIVTIVVYWFVFEFGLKAGSPIVDVPFIIWFSAGLIPWFFFQDAILNATNCMIEYSYLVKKVLFKISLLPLVKAISAFFVHVVFVIFLFIIATVYGFTPSIYSIQLIYYSFCVFCLVLALSYATSAIIVFFKDFGQLINIFLQVGMWMTPIMWSYTIVPENLRWITFLNPMCYIVEGYRDTFINHVWFYDKYLLMIYFWIVILVLFTGGTIIFKKLKPHFADVL